MLFYTNKNTYIYTSFKINYIKSSTMKYFGIVFITYQYVLRRVQKTVEYRTK